MAPWREWLLLGGALVATAVLLWAVSGEPVVAVAFAGGALLLGGALRLACACARRWPRPFAAPDWSVTHAAIERPDMGIAITDRAGRLACASLRFSEWFGLGAARRACRCRSRRPKRSTPPPAPPGATGVPRWT
jgi:two-component system cell cycle sensor histidine kinase/response regulator CckA